MRRSLLTLLLATSLVSACTASEPLQPSGIEAPSVWSRLRGPSEKSPLMLDEQASIEHEWWKQFGDPALNQLINEALASNKTLLIAEERIEEARAGRMLAQSQLLPQINGTAGIARGNDGLLSGDKPMTFTQAAVEASWEIDLFGRNQARSRSAQAMIESAEARRDATRVALLAEIARTYFDLRNYERQIEITTHNLETQQKTLSLVNDQFEQALASDFDVQRTRAQVATTRAQIPLLRTAYEAALNRLSVLTGNTPGVRDALLKTPQPMAPISDKILVSAPASVLAARPDIRAAERQFSASISDYDAAFAELFPRISLLGLFGIQESGSLSANPWSAGANLVMPLLNFGTIQSQINAADAREQQAFLSYQQTVLLALEDMENALSSYRNETERAQALANAMESTRKAVTLSNQQFTNGYSSLLDVLIAERGALDAESAYIASETKLRKDLVGIYAAAGGGWRAQENGTTPPAAEESNQVTLP